MSLGFQEPIGHKFRAANNWAVRNGLGGAWPTFHFGNKLDGKGQYYGHMLLPTSVADFADVPASEYKNFGATTPVGMLAAAHDFAIRNGYAAGFPNWHQAEYSGEVVYGTILIRQEVVLEWRDVPSRELFDLNPFLSDNPWDIPAMYWIRASSDYGGRHGFVTGLPTGHSANYGSGYVCGVFLLAAPVEFKDIYATDLRLDPGQLRPSAPRPKTPSVPSPPRSGTAYFGLSRAPSSDFSYQGSSVDPNEWAVELGNIKPAVITNLRASHNCSLRYRGSGVSVALDAGQSVDAFNGLPVKAEWSATFGGKAAESPSAISLTVEWKVS